MSSIYIVIRRAYFATVLMFVVPALTSAHSPHFTYYVRRLDVRCHARRPGAAHARVRCDAGEPHGRHRRGALERGLPDERVWVRRHGWRGGVPQPLLPTAGPVFTKYVRVRGQSFVPHTC